MVSAQPTHLEALRLVRQDGVHVGVNTYIHALFQT